MYFQNYGSDSTSQPCDANIDINLWYNSSNGGSFYSPTIPCLNVSSSLADSYDNYDNYDYDSYDSYEYDYYNEFDAENFSEDENALIYGENFHTYWMIISCMASKEDGSQSWLLLEKPFFLDYLSETPKGFCECIHNENIQNSKKLVAINENEGKEYATTETIKNCYVKSVSVSEAARSMGRPVRPPLGHPMEAPVRKQQIRANKEVEFTNDKKKPNETKQY